MDFCIELRTLQEPGNPRIAQNKPLYKSFSIPSWAKQSTNIIGRVTQPGVTKTSNAAYTLGLRVIENDLWTEDAVNQRQRHGKVLRCIKKRLEARSYLHLLFERHLREQVIPHTCIQSLQGFS